jgi:DNA-binding NarL/FixJ family response regulator
MIFWSGLNSSKFDGQPEIEFFPQICKPQDIHRYFLRRIDAMEAETSQVCILVALGNRVLRESLCLLLRSRQPLGLYLDNVEKVSTPPDLVLFDSSKSLEALQLRCPKAKFILIDGGLKKQEITYLLLSNRVAGVIPPGADIELFFKALKVVQGGQLWIDNDHLKALLEHSGSLTSSGGIKSLSCQDMKIVQLVVLGQTNVAIAEQLCLSQYTIKAHISRIMKKLNITRRIELAHLFLENGQKP